MPGHAELQPGDRLGGDLEGHQARVVDEHAVARVGQAERYVLVRLLAAGSAVGVPHVDDLAVLDQRAEPLAKPVHGGVRGQAELLAHVVAARWLVRAGRGGHDRGGARVARGEQPAARQELQPPVRARPHPRGQLARGEHRPLAVAEGPGRRRRVFVKRERGRTAHLPGEVRDAHRDHVRGGGAQRERDHRPLEQVTPVPDPANGGQDGERPLAGLGVEHLDRVEHLNTGTQQPAAIGELHARGCLSCAVT